MLTSCRNILLKACIILKSLCSWDLFPEEYMNAAVMFLTHLELFIEYHCDLQFWWDFMLWELLMYFMYVTNWGCLIPLEKRYHKEQMELVPSLADLAFGQKHHSFRLMLLCMHWLKSLGLKISLHFHGHSPHSPSSSWHCAKYVALTAGVFGRCPSAGHGVHPHDPTHRPRTTQSWTRHFHARSGRSRSHPSWVPRSWLPASKRIMTIKRRTKSCFGQPYLMDDLPNIWWASFLYSLFPIWSGKWEWDLQYRRALEIILFDSPNNPDRVVGILSFLRIVGSFWVVRMLVHTSLIHEKVISHMHDCWRRRCRW